MSEKLDKLRASLWKRKGSVALKSTLALKALNDGFRKQKLPR